MSRYEPSQTRRNLGDVGINLDLATEDHNDWTLVLPDGGKIRNRWEDWIENSELANFLYRMRKGEIR